jgi:hypothetical protein
VATMHWEDKPARRVYPVLIQVGKITAVRLTCNDLSEKRYPT